MTCRGHGSRSRSCHALRLVARCATPIGRTPATFTKIPQDVRDERSDPVLVEPRGVGRRHPGDERAAELGELRERHRAERRLDERALTRSSHREALRLQLLVGFRHGVRVDRKLRDHVTHPWKLIAGHEVAEAERVLDLMDELKVGRHARAGVEPEPDRRYRFAFGSRRRVVWRASLFYYGPGGIL